MIKIFFAASTRGFYDSETHGDNMPADAVEIPPERRTEILALLSSGKVLGSDEEGYPVANDPPPPTLQAMKAAKRAQIMAAADAVAAQVTAGYPEFEKQTWGEQRAEALAWAADPAAPTPRIDAMAGYRGIDREVYLQRTVAKVQVFQGISDYLVGTRQKYDDQVTVAQSEEDLDEIEYVFSLPG